MKYTEEYLRERLMDVAYMIRNYDVADDEETRIMEVYSDDEVDMSYLDQLPDPVKEMCLTAIKFMNSHLLAIDIYCRYWLREAKNVKHDLWKEVYEKWLEEWLEDLLEVYKDDPESLRSEKKIAQEWYQIGCDWSYWR